MRKVTLVLQFLYAVDRDVTCFLWRVWTSGIVLAHAVDDSFLSHFYFVFSDILEGCNFQSCYIQHALFSSAPPLYLFHETVTIVESRFSEILGKKALHHWGTHRIILEWLQWWSFCYFATCLPQSNSRILKSWGLKKVLGPVINKQSIQTWGTRSIRPIWTSINHSLCPLRNGSKLPLRIRGWRVSPFEK